MLKMEESCIVLCDIHPDENIVSFCFDCDSLVCIECINDEKKHCKHHFVKVTKVASKKRAELMSLIQHEKDTVSENLQCCVTEQCDSRQNYSKLQEDMVNAMSKRADEMKAFIDRTRDDKIAKVHKVFQSYIDHTAKTENEAKEIMEEINKLYEERETLKEKSDTKIIQVEISLKHRISNILDHKIDPSESIPLFIDGGQFEDSLERIYGTLEIESESGSDFNEDSVIESSMDSTVKPMRSLVNKETAISSLCSVTRICLADYVSGWVLDSYQNLYHFDIEKNKSKNVSTSVCDATLAQVIGKNELMIVSENSHIIKIVNEDYKITHWCDMTPYYPKCLCTTQTGAIVVSMYQNKQNAKCCATFKFDNRGRKVAELFGISRNIDFTSITENVNTDFCIIQNISNKNRLGVYDANGSFKYDVKNIIGPNLEGYLDVVDFCCDNKGRIIVPDRNNHTIYLLDSEGKFIRHLVNPGEISYPRCIALDPKGQLWIANTCHAVCIIKNWDC